MKMMAMNLRCYHLWNVENCTEHYLSGLTTVLSGGQTHDVQVLIHSADL